MRAVARALAERHNAPFRFVECRASNEACQARLALRAQHSSVSDGRLAIFDEFRAQFEAVDELPANEHLVLDTEQAMENTRATLLALPSIWPAPGAAR
jgi:predicted kinase